MIDSKWWWNQHINNPEEEVEFPEEENLPDWKQEEFVFFDEEDFVEEGEEEDEL